MKLFGNTMFLATLCWIATSLAQGQATRTWVSGVGDDANPCSRTAPCKTFAGAISKTQSGGEIDALDPGGFGAVTITKAITIDGNGTLASVLVAGTNGIIIQAGGNDSVVLRNLSINGIGSGINGIRFLSGKELHLENVVIGRFTGNGLDFQAPGASVAISDSIFRDNGAQGIFMSLPSGGGGFMKLTMVRSSVKNNGVGMVVKDNGRATIQDSSISNNTTTGVQSFANLGFGQSEISLEHCIIANNGGTGILAGGVGALAPSDFFISNNEIINNVGAGVQVSTNGFVFTFSNNRIQGNGTDGCGCSIAPLN